MENFNNVTQDWTHADQFLDEKINRNTNSIKHDFDIVEKNVEVLNGVAEGQFVTDSTAMSVKVVPENAVKGIVSMIGGKTVKQDDVLLNAPVKKVVLTDKNENKTTLSLERIVDKLPDYGASVSDNLYNYVDFERMVYVHRVSEMTLDNKDWLWQSDWASWYTVDTLVKNAAGNDDASNIIAAKYTNSSMYSITNKITGSIAKAGGTSTTLACCTGSSTVKPTGKIVFEMATPEEIPLTDLILPFKCEPGGTVTFENEHNLDVPNSVIYEKEMK